MIGIGKLVLDVEATFKALLRAEDLDGDGKITVDDRGPKVQRQPTIAADH